MMVIIRLYKVRRRGQGSIQASSPEFDDGRYMCQSIINPAITLAIVIGGVSTQYAQNTVRDRSPSPRVAPISIQLPLHEFRVDATWPTSTLIGYGRSTLSRHRYNSWVTHVIHHTIHTPTACQGQTKPLQNAPRPYSNRGFSFGYHILLVPKFLRRMLSVSERRTDMCLRGKAAAGRPEIIVTTIVNIHRERVIGLLIQCLEPRGGDFPNNYSSVASAVGPQVPIAAVVTRLEGEDGEMASNDARWGRRKMESESAVRDLISRNCGGTGPQAATGAEGSRELTEAREPRAPSPEVQANSTPAAQRQDEEANQRQYITTSSGGPAPGGGRISQRETSREPEQEVVDVAPPSAHIVGPSTEAAGHEQARPEEPEMQEGGETRPEETNQERPRGVAMEPNSGAEPLPAPEAEARANSRVREVPKFRLLQTPQRTDGHTNQQQDVGPQRTNGHTDQQEDVGRTWVCEWEELDMTQTDS
ncbi:hypothetical protein BU15DRAFT_65699 [Melanogaster broomeanus]|nr:hypothetical protein BU15DRAFT_65699 [Melanogaster broomeanus]